MGGLLGDYLQSERAQQAAHRAQEFSRRMSSTAWQRAMVDMREAGLNPILAYKTGPASSPMGTNSFPASSGAGLGSMMIDAGKAVTAEKTARKERPLKGAQATQATTAAAANITHATQMTAQTALLGEQALKTREETRNTAAQASISEARAVRENLDKDIYSSGRGRFLNEANKWMQPIGNLLGFTIGGAATRYLRPGGRGGRPGGSRLNYTKPGRRNASELSNIPTHPRPRRRR